MNSTKTIMARAAIAAAALGASIIPASGALAAPACTGPCSTYSGVVTINSTLNIQPSTGSFVLTAIPGQTSSPPAFTITLTSSDSAGYSVAESLSTQFGTIPNTDWSTDVSTPPVPPATDWVITPHSYDAAGSAIPIFSWGGVSGNAGTGTTGPVTSDGTNDIVATQIHLHLPGSFPGSPVAGYSGAFNYTILGA